jgi:hypothetical protein
LTLLVSAASIEVADSGGMRTKGVRNPANLAARDTDAHGLRNVSKRLSTGPHRLECLSGPALETSVSDLKLSNRFCDERRAEIAVEDFQPLDEDSS